MNKTSPLLTFLTLYSLAAYAACPSWPTDAFFTLNGAEVLDRRTSLVWKRCSEGQSWNEGSSTCSGTVGTYTLKQAQALAKAASSNGAAWRLPNTKELSDLSDPGCKSPAIDSKAFPATPSAAFWAAASNEGESSYASYVYFDRGGISEDYQSGSGHVRLVRPR